MEAKLKKKFHLDSYDHYEFDDKYVMSIDNIGIILLRFIT